MKGVKYNVKMTCPNDESINYDSICMKECIDKIKSHLNDKYHIDIAISRNIVYNLIKRKEKSNKILRNICEVEIVNSF